MTSNPQYFGVVRRTEPLVTVYTHDTENPTYSLSVRTQLTEAEIYSVVDALEEFLLNLREPVVPKVSEERQCCLDIKGEY